MKSQGNLRRHYLWNFFISVQVRRDGNTQCSFYDINFIYIREMHLISSEASTLLILLFMVVEMLHCWQFGSLSLASIGSGLWMLHLYYGETTVVTIVFLYWTSFSDLLRCKKIGRFLCSDQRLESGGLALSGQVKVQWRIIFHSSLKLVCTLGLQITILKAPPGRISIKTRWKSVLNVPKSTIC